MSYLYAALIGLVALAAVGFSAWSLRHLDNLGPPEINPPWWRTWRRPAAVCAVAFLFGALSQLSGSQAPAFLLVLFGVNIAPLLYPRIGLGLWSLEAEIAATWALWLSARVLVGGDLLDLWPTAAIPWVGTSIGGGIILRKVNINKILRK